MTNEEAKDYIREWCPYDKHEKIINALEQQPCDDCISREKVINDLKLAYFDKDIQSVKNDPCVIDSMIDWAIRTVKAQPSVQPKQGWNPCSEGLPKEDGEYLCTLIGEHDTGEPRECGFIPYGIKELIGGWSTCEADGFVKLADSEVIAWMPLPEKYKKG